MKKTITLVTLTLSLAFAKESHGQATQQEQPKELKYIMELAGSWEGPAIMKMDGKELHFPYYADFRKTATNSGLEMFEHCDIPGMGKLTGSNLIGFDPYDGKIHWYTVDNLGTTHEHIGSFSDHDHFTMVHKGTREGKEYVETIQMVRKGNDKLSLSIIAATNGHEDESISVNFRRKGTKPVAAK